MTPPRVTKYWVPRSRLFQHYYGDEENDEKTYPYVYLKAEADALVTYWLNKAVEYQQLIAWLLGEVGEFPSPPERKLGKTFPMYWWRTELRQRAQAILESKEG